MDLSEQSAQGNIGSNSESRSTLLQDLTWSPDFMDGPSSRGYVLLKFGLSLAIFFHVFVLVAAQVSAVRPIFVVNLVSIPAYILSLIYLLRTKRIALPYYCLHLEMPIHAFLSVLAIGLDGGLFLFGLAPSAFTFFAVFFSWKIRVVLTVVNVVVFALIAVTGVVHEQWYELSLSWQVTLMAFSGFGIAISVAVTVGVNQWVALKAEEELENEYARSESLLYNLLPEEIAARLKVEPNRTIADKLPQVAILFADIVDFTPRAAMLPPEQVVGLLNRIFSRFDRLAEKHGLEKIKTIGDAYMVAAGMPTPIGKPVQRIAEMALDMQRATREMSQEFPEGLQVRIGLHSGPAVAGVIGNNKLFYDVWGETVNTASRMESHGEPGRIQVTGPAYEELEKDYLFEPRGTVDVKGMGPVETWWLLGKTPAA